MYRRDILPSNALVQSLQSTYSYKISLATSQLCQCLHLLLFLELYHLYRLFQRTYYLLHSHLSNYPLILSNPPPTNIPSYLIYLSSSNIIENIFFKSLSFSLSCLYNGLPIHFHSQVFSFSLLMCFLILLPPSSPILVLNPFLGDHYLIFFY